MKVKQLIKKLQKLNQEALVVLSSDEEGNRYSIISEDMGTGEWFNTETNEFYGPDDPGEPNVKLAIVLYPS